MKTYFFVLGRSFDLCKAELDVLLVNFSGVVDRVVGHVVIVKCGTDIDLNALVQRAGGVVKAGELFYSGGVDSDLAEPVVSYFKSHFDSKKFRFGISGYGDGFFKKFVQEFVLSLSRTFDQQSLAHSYVLPENNEISSVQIDKYHLSGDRGADVVIMRDHEVILYGVTQAVQPFHLWSQFDYGRPSRDAQSGMLPPKVARMMLHLGLGYFAQSKQTLLDAPIVYDPFCGSGTIMTEAIRLGCRVVGSDISEKAVSDTRDNLLWTHNSRFCVVHPGEADPFFGYHHEVFDESRVTLFVSEVAHAPRFLTSIYADIIVTEPYLGPAFSAEPTPGKIERIIKGLQKMYFGAFSAFRKVQKPGGVLVFAEPVYFGGHKTYTVGIIDNSARYGYTLKSQILTYSREQSFVGRRVGVLVRN